MRIERSQFGAWEIRNFPKFDNNIYLEREIVTTGLSTEVVHYGYRLISTRGTSSVFVWIPKIEALKFIQMNKELAKRYPDEVKKGDDD